MKKLPRVPLLILAGALALLLALALLSRRAASRVNPVALSQRPKGVTVIPARAASYRASRRYVGTVLPWLEARVGPQITAAYVDTVLVRPGDAVQRGQVLATLDCRNASAQSRALALQARALHATQEALSKEASRVSGLLSGGFVSENEVERRTAESAAKQAELLSAQARSLRASLEVDDCVLRAPFTGEVADRLLDPGGFARPGAPLLILVDRAQVRVAVDVPEGDFAVVAPGAPVRLRVNALAAELGGRISRRSPAADGATRTIHAEVDLADAQRRLPVGTTVEVTIPIGAATPALLLPLKAASVRGDQATVYVVSAGVARRQQLAVLGESGAELYVAPALAAGAQVVVEGRALLQDGDRVAAAEATP